MKMENGSQPLIRLDSVSKVFVTDEVETHALQSIHFDVKKGEYLSISGPSGCGKSTLLAILGLLDTPTDGTYYLNGKSVTGLKLSERARIRNREIGFIFQAFNLIGDLTVYENVELPLTYRGMPSAERKRRVQEALERVGMSHRMKHYPAQLSGGQQQRVAVARALAGDPLILLADEPTGNLDSTNGEAVMDLLRDLHQRRALTGAPPAHRASRSPGDKPMDILIQDIHYALRSLRRSPGFALTVIAVMALGIGVNSMIYTVVHGTLLADLPFPHVERMVRVKAHSPRDKNSFSMSLPDTRDVMARVSSLRATSAWQEFSAFFAAGDEPRRYQGTLASSGLPEALGVAPQLGRWFTPDECRMGASYVPVVLGGKLWREAFHADPHILGTTLSVNGRPRAVVGVMPESFRFPETSDVFVPLAM